MVPGVSVLFNDDFSMRKLLIILAIGLLAAATNVATASEMRFALVIGNASYKAKTLATAVNDAALVAQTLQAAGFDVTGARDLEEDLLRQTFRKFVDSVARAGPDAVVVVYFAGYALQLDGENYLVPTDANIGDVSGVPLHALRLSDQMQALAALHLKTTFVILDAARASPLVLSGEPLAGGLAWVEPEANMLIAFNAAPGTVSPDDGESYGPYASALAEMIRQGGLTPANLFGRVRLRVNEFTKGAQVPWDASKIETQFVFFERGPGAPPRVDSPEHAASMRFQPMRSLGARDAYTVALLRDTFDAYADFLADYWHDPMTKRVRALLAARREAITWRRTYQANVPEAYWSYLRRYPHGPHTADAGRLLTRLGAAFAPPSKFPTMEYDVPSPLPDESEYIARAALVFDDPAFAFELPPPSSTYFLEPPPPELLALKPPAAASEPHILPAPVFVPLPVYVHLPAYVVAPPSWAISSNDHKTPVVNSTNNVPATPIGPTASNKPADSPLLPSSIATTATQINDRSPPPAPSNPVVREEIKVSPNPEVPVVPLWATLDPAKRAEIKTPTSASLPMVSLTPLWATMDPASEEIFTMPAPPSPQLPPPLSRGSAMPSLQATGSIPLPIPRPLTPKSIRGRSKPMPNVASTASPTAADQAKQPTASAPKPSTHAAGAPGAAVGVLPSKPERNPCRVKDGRLICD